MNNKCCKFKRITALLLMLLMLLPSAPALAESYSAAVTDSVAAYADASLTRKVGDLERYDVVTVTGIKGEVARIRYGGYTMYTRLGALVAVKDFATAATVQTANRVYQSPDTSSQSLALKQGTSVYILATSGDWAMIEKDGNVGYTFLSCLQSAGSGSSETESDPFLPDGDSSNNTGDLAGSGSGASSNSSVTIETVEAVVTSATLPVYASASTSSKKLGTLKAGQAVTVHAYTADWAYISLSGKYGFCALKGLQKKTGGAAEETPENPFDPGTAVPATVTASSVTVYQSASSSAKKLGTLKKGAEVKLLKVSGNWAYIELNGNYGYCAASALTKNSELDSNPTDSSAMGSCTVVSASAKAYAKKSTSAANITLSMGDTLDFYGYDSKWVQVKINGKTGYMLRSDLSPASYAELKNEDSGDAVKTLESALLSLGYLDSVPSSNFSANTVTALKRMQAACGMEQTGIADVATQRVLYSGNAPASPLLSASLTSGSSGENVTRLQNRLLALGYLCQNSSVDGDYGSTTASAIKLFQTAAGGSATGVADSATIRALYSTSAPKLPSGSKAADYKENSYNGSSTVSGMPAGLESTTSSYNSSMSNAQKLEHVIYVAQNQLGKKYVFGATGTATFDCSGLTQYCFKQIGVTLKRTAYAEGYNDERPKLSGISSLRRGDLVFFNTVSDGDLCDHTGIYLGSNMFIHASSGAGKVIVSNLSSGYYNRVFSWGRRVLSA
ncbi:MAG: peptidoglycan-binding protein [Clostridia bacterium]|nr:peptidoglycan-binding protein [Clostridia bacterium]